MQHTEPIAVERSLAVYLWLLRAYPPAFREKYRTEMALAFRDAARDAWRGAGFAGLIGLWARTLADTVVNASRERLQGSNEGVAMTRWEVSTRKVRSTVAQMLPVLAALGAIGIGLYALTDRWLPTTPPSSRGWVVLAAAIIMGLPLGLVASRVYRVAWWNCSIRSVGMFGWAVWYASSKSVGLDGFWAFTLSMIPLFSFAFSRDERNETDTEWTSTIARKEHLLIAGPALLLVLTSPAPYLATNVFLLFVAVVNGVAALLPAIVLRARKGDVGPK